MREKKDSTQSIDPYTSQEIAKIDQMSDTEINDKLLQMLVS